MLSIGMCKVRCLTVCGDVSVTLPISLMYDYCFCVWLFYFTLTNYNRTTNLVPSPKKIKQIPVERTTKEQKKGKMKQTSDSNVVPYHSTNDA